MRLVLCLLALPLVLVACESDPDTVAVAPVDPAAPAETADDVIRGSLEAGDDTLVSGEYMDLHEVLAREGQWIRAEVISGDFDPYVIVLSPTDVQTDVDDSAEGNTTMTRAILEASEAGEWKVVVTSFAPGETGEYEMTVEVTDEAPDDADQGVQVGPEAGATDV